MPSRVLFDTNILVYFLNNASNYYAISEDLIQKASMGKLTLYLSVQNLNECLRVVLSSKAFTKPLSWPEALEKIESLERLAYIIYPRSESFTIHKKLFKTYAVGVRNLYDNFLAATMLSYGIQTLYTHNAKDFKIYKELEIINPFSNLDGK